MDDVFSLTSKVHSRTYFCTHSRCDIYTAAGESQLHNARFCVIICYGVDTHKHSPAESHTCRANVRVCEMCRCRQFTCVHAGCKIYTRSCEPNSEPDHTS